jgi:hypothetical protein
MQIHAMEMSYPISTDGVVAGTYEKPEGTVHITNGAAGNQTTVHFVFGFNEISPSTRHIT